MARRPTVKGMCALHPVKMAIAARAALVGPPMSRTLPITSTDGVLTMSRSIPTVKRWRVSVYWTKPYGTTQWEVRHYYVNTPTRYLASLAARDVILADVGPGRFATRDRVIFSRPRKES